MIDISAVSYTNTIPFIYGLQHHDIIKEINLSLDIPSVCAQKLRAKKVDIGLIPVAAILDLEEAHIISDYCIGANGAVDSVFIFSNCPIDEIKYLSLDPESRSSNQLALVLLKKHWKINPELIYDSNTYGLNASSKSAFVQIGDRSFGQKNKHPYAYDLAAEWKNFTGLEFVFAAWVSNKILNDEFITQFNEALKYGLANRLKIASQIHQIKDFDVTDYLMNKIDYQLTKNKKEALMLFHQYIKALELV
jgi:chorismate dehydratase